MSNAELSPGGNVRKIALEEHFVTPDLAVSILKITRHTSVAAACRHHAGDATRTLSTLGLSPA
jgi:hypothetical protein